MKNWMSSFTAALRVIFTDYFISPESTSFTIQHTVIYERE
jgi:hypothetical protein